MNSAMEGDAALISAAAQDAAVSGGFVDEGEEKYYAIRNVDKMAPFFMSVVSNADHWLFVSSTGGLTAGRVSPETSLFPYITVDKIHESTPHTGSRTLIRVNSGKAQQYWEPFNYEHDQRYAITRNLYKNLLGNKLRFEEINHDLQLVFRYTWQTSDRYGFIRQCELQNLGANERSLDLLDGLQNILPAGASVVAQTNTSNLVDAYKWTELDESTGLGLFTLFSGVSDRAAPCESLKANTVFCLGLEGHKIHLSSQQLNRFRCGAELHHETHTRGTRGDYLVSATLNIAPREMSRWSIVADVSKSQTEVVTLREQLANPQEVKKSIMDSAERGSDELAKIMGAGDGFQATAEETVSVHHYANVLFNVLRGGIFDDQYNVWSWDFAGTIKKFNRNVYQRNRKLIDALPEIVSLTELLAAVKDHGDLQLERLSREYLPITFGRRHGDPSRPWNRFAIELRNAAGERLLSYQGNWRDIFQNWEALAFSYPEFVENIIAKFVNASTIDGYNPYRITKDGIDWEVEDPHDPWSYIGYWGDHQIIYLQKLLELSQSFHPTGLSDLLRKPIFSYANVPYRIKPFDALLEDSKNTVDFDDALAGEIESRIGAMGADGKLVLNANGEVHQVNLLEKLLVPLLCKLGNLVVDGGIWMNTQRPEWNDANNALVGNGLSMVTLYYLRRYVCFLQELLAAENGSTEVSKEVSRWLTDTIASLSGIRPLLGDDPIDPAHRYESMVKLCVAADNYRQTVYEQRGFSRMANQPIEPIKSMLYDTLAVIDHSIDSNKRTDGLYHTYNVLDVQQETATVGTLYPMLEGQVAALTSGAMSPDEAASIVEALFDSDIYRPDQHTFMLYPDRALPRFLDKNRIPHEHVEANSLLKRMLSNGDHRIVDRDAEGSYRFNAGLRNIGELDAALDVIAADYGDEFAAQRESARDTYELVFNHKSFTGRSGGMFAYEGLGSVYWHMVSKLLLAVQENFFQAVEQHADSAVCRRLADLYYRVRNGLGFNKTPLEYGAFPTDPYSHTPKHAGAKQPGMTGQVKEEILSRFGELGVRVHGGSVHFQPNLLRAREFISSPRRFRFLDVDGNWQELSVAARGLAFTWCQVPVVYELSVNADPELTVTWSDGQEQTLKQSTLPPEMSAEVFARNGRIRQLTLKLGAEQLYSE